ncbi:MFS transporter, DHA1 family, bicyclomycin/chloramphenicol resistance protein [Poseidonocella pacifica]|uniref:Bcr/CflA family efflux transporter n=1 Tax=Poseidonocella pacifica TaxID=871651 RepID=A0A1I0XAD2_9RHOB|nr:multidrug effflux MFS transporter [Poseidonocella pacifica]SFA98002.1 MFS transporter, DHA1 family, bicyclomycin/chloramphenicol resistance protein [Poseidonocella pacifica]
MQNAPEVRYLDRTTAPHISTLILLAGISAMAMNIFLPSLPRMTEHFQTDYRVMQLSVALYLAVNAVLQIAIGPISDKFGRRPIMLWGLGIFLVATLGCIFAPTVEVFLVFRMLQSVVVVGMVLSRAVVRDMVAADRSASMIGYVTMGMALVPMIAPALGGFLDGAFGWEANFWALFIFGTGLVWLTWKDLGETSVSSGLTLGQQFREYPELLTSRRFWAFSLANAFASGAFFAYLGGAPFVGSEVYGLDPETLGLYFGAPAIGYMLGNFISGKFSVRIGINRMVVYGTMINAIGIGLALIAFGLGFGSAQTFFAFMTFVGLGNGMTIPNATAAMLSVRPRLAGTASGLGGAIMIGGGAVLSALAGAALSPGTGAWPLLWIMFATACAAIASIAYGLYRERQVAP